MPGYPKADSPKNSFVVCDFSMSWHLVKIEVTDEATSHHGMDCKIIILSTAALFSQCRSLYLAALHRLITSNCHQKCG
jgi:hypothetical protein